MHAGIFLPAHPPNPYLSTRSPVCSLATRPARLPPVLLPTLTSLSPVRRFLASDIPKQLGIRQCFQILYAICFECQFALANGHRGQGGGRAGGSGGGRGGGRGSGRGDRSDGGDGE